MAHKRKERSDVNDSELEDSAYKYYKELRDGRIKVKVTDKLFQCPYCREFEKKDYAYSEILRHASRAGRESTSSSFIEKTRHLGLARFLDENIESSKKTRNVGPIEGEGSEDSIVYPWMVLVANIPLVKKDGKYVAKKDKDLQDEWTAQGFNPKKVKSFWDSEGHTGFVVIEFDKNWSGLTSAMMFEKALAMDTHGKRDWFSRRCRRGGDKLHAWIARGQEYNSEDRIGYFIRKNGDLRTISDIETEYKRKDSMLLCDLNNILEVKNKQCEEINSKISRTEIVMRNVMRQKETMVQHFNKDMEKLEQMKDDRLNGISKEHEQHKLQLETRRKELESREKGLYELIALNQIEKEKLENERAIVAQKNAEETMLKLAEYHKRERYKLHQRALELEKELDQNQQLQLEIQQLKGKVEVMGHFSVNEDTDERKKMESIRETLKEKEEDLEDMEALRQALIIREKKSSEELQEARKELINGLRTRHASNASIFVKIIGHLDEKTFHVAVKRKYSDEKVEEKAVELCSLWKDYLRNPTWHPLKVIMVSGEPKEIIDEEDDKIKNLRNEYGDEVYNAVTKALIEIIKYNPTARFPLTELWNRTEDRKATLKEGIEYVLRLWKHSVEKRN